MSEDEHSITRSTRDDDGDGDETFECPDCERVFTDEEKFRNHRENATRKRLQGSPVGDAILERKQQMERALRRR